MATNLKRTDHTTLFGRTNYIIILLACMTIAVGLFLMAGDGSTEHAFQADIFSKRRIVVAPIVCITGYLGIIIGILWRSRVKNASTHE